MGKIAQTELASWPLTEGDALELAKELYQQCGEKIGHATAVLAEVESKPDSIREAAMKIAEEQVTLGQSFCFRLNKRGAHNLPSDTPKIEHEIGGAIYVALEQKDRTKPTVTLSDPDVTIIAEVLGASTLVGILRKDWQTLPLIGELKSKMPSEEPIALAKVKAPTLLIVGGYDDLVIGLNEDAYAQLSCEKELRIVPGATHLFEEPGTLAQVAHLAAEWFKQKLQPRAFAKTT